MEKTPRQQHWEEVLRAQAASGMTKKAFCAERGIPVAQFYYWQRRMRELQKTQPLPSAGFQELSLKAGPELEVRLPDGAWIGVRAHDARGLSLLLEAISLSHA